MRRLLRYYLYCWKPRYRLYSSMVPPKMCETLFKCRLLCLPLNSIPMRSKPFIPAWTRLELLLLATILHDADGLLDCQKLCRSILYTTGWWSRCSHNIFHFSSRTSREIFTYACMCISGYSHQPYLRHRRALRAEAYAYTDLWTIYNDSGT